MGVELGTSKKHPWVNHQSLQKWIVHVSLRVRRRGMDFFGAPSPPARKALRSKYKTCMHNKQRETIIHILAEHASSVRLSLVVVLALTRINVVPSRTRYINNTYSLSLSLAHAAEKMVTTQFIPDTKI
jgi:hypothetical protein